MNILLVEDNDVDVLIFERALKRAGIKMSIVRARDGVEALEILTNQNSHQAVYDPYVILLDINMPRMNGHDFLRTMRADKNIAGARVVVVTTSDDQSDIDLAYGHQACGYVVKPTSTSEMSDVIQKLDSYWGLCKHPTPRVHAPPNQEA